MLNVLDFPGRRPVLAPLPAIAAGANQASCHEALHRREPRINAWGLKTNLRFRCS